jgi:hypothetical protein
MVNALCIPSSPGVYGEIGESTLYSCMDITPNMMAPCDARRQWSKTCSNTGRDEITAAPSNPLNHTSMLLP